MYRDASKIHFGIPHNNMFELQNGGLWINNT